MNDHDQIIEMATDIKYLKSGHDEIRKEIESAKNRNIVMLTSIIFLLLGTVVNIIVSYVSRPH